MTARKTAKHTIEQSLKRLEEIVNLMEGGKISLDEALELYEEGVSVARECAEKLKTAELKIKKLSRDAQGQFEIGEAEEE